MSAAPATDDGLAVRANVFQGLMLQWERFAPYNAGQYATLAAEVDEERARGAWHEVVIELGLQQLGQTPCTGVAFVNESIESHVTRELNRPFATGNPPLRPFLQRSGARPNIGIIYRHAVADSASIRVLVRAWLERLLELPISTRHHIGLLQDGGLRLIDGRRTWSLLREGTADLSRLSRAKRARRLFPTADPSSAVEWRRFELPHGIAARLVAYARRRSVRVNDLFVAAAALACDELMPHENVDIRRDLGIGTIADVRPADRPADRHFGVMLGFLQTFWRWQDLGRWDRVLAVAASQSRAARERSLAEASVIRLLTAKRIGDRQTLPELATFYRKRCPLAAGISNVNLNRGWPALLHPTPIAGYTRVSPLGPILPLVITPTTLGETLHIGVTHRVSVLSRERVAQIIDLFIERLDRESR